MFQPAGEKEVTRAMVEGFLHDFQKYAAETDVIVVGGRAERFNGLEGTRQTRGEYSPYREKQLCWGWFLDWWISHEQGDGSRPLKNLGRAGCAI
jgi:hypothetical protein